jgi:hypothetical protein
LLTSGQKDEAYFSKVRSLDIGEFYKQQGGHFLEQLRNQWHGRYDFVLIDSRTGVTDIGGVCTVQLPDILVLLFTTNDQSLDGIVQIAEKARRVRKTLPFDRFSLKCLPVASRVDAKEEFKEYQQWLEAAVPKLKPLMSNWLPDASSWKFVELSKLPYIPFFSFGEKLAIIEQGTSDNGGLGYAYESLAGLVANDLAYAARFVEDRDPYIRAALKGKSFDDEVEKEQHRKGSTPSKDTSVTPRYDFFISYAHADRSWAEWVAWQLEEAGYTTVLQAWDFRPGANFVLVMQQAASDAHSTIALLSPDYLLARFTQPEWQAAFAQDPTGEQGRLIPVRVREFEMGGFPTSIVYIDLVGLDEAAARITLLNEIRRGRAKPVSAPQFPGMHSQVRPTPSWPLEASAPARARAAESSRDLAPASATDVTDVATSYFVTKVLDESYSIKKETLQDIKDNILQLTQEPTSQLPSVALVGLGRCGTNVCEDIRDILLESRGTQTPTKKTMGLLDLMRDYLVQQQRDTNAFLKVSSEPMIIAIDLDVNTFQRLEGIKSKYSRFVPVEVDWPGGAGNIQIIGEYQARKLLTLPPNRIKSKNWKHVFSYLIDSAGLEINPSRVFFYIFSTGGGTGSGMSTEMGFAQRKARIQRLEDVINATTQDVATAERNTDLGFKPSPTFSCALGVLPEISNKQRVSEAVHLNSGRLLCKFLSLTMSRDNEESTRYSTLSSDLPWTCLILVSNESVASKIRAMGNINVTAGDFEKITNLYIAKQIINLISAQITAADASREDWDLFGIGGGDRYRLDATDLIVALYGLNAVAFDQEIPTSKGGFSLTSLFLNSLRPTEVVDKGGANVVRGISVLPGSLDKYEKLFDGKDEEVAQRLSEVPMFERAVSSLTVVSVPKDYKPDIRDISELRKLTTNIFKNAIVRRYALVRSVGTEVTITTFISSNSIVLTTECLLLLSAYMRRCFARDRQAARELDKLFFSIVDVSKEITREERLKLLDAFETLVLSEERLEEFTAAPFSGAKDVHEAAFRQVNPEGFISIDQLRLKSADLKKALLAIIDTITFEQDDNIVPDLLGKENSF